MLSAFLVTLTAPIYCTLPINSLSLMQAVGFNFCPYAHWAQHSSSNVIMNTCQNQPAVVSGLPFK